MRPEGITMEYDHGRRVLDVAIAGFGGVARALARFIAESPAGSSPAIRVVAVADSLGCVYDASGISYGRLLELASAKEGGVGLGAAPSAIRGPKALEETLRGRWPSVLVEAGPTSLDGGGGSTERAVAALRAGASVALASKGPVASAWDELVWAAGDQDQMTRRLRFSATVGAGMPIVDAGYALAAGSPLRGIAACLNGTSSLVLGLMEGGAGLDAAIAKAQELGMAEADPSADLDGLDAAAKLCILSRAILGAPLSPAEVERESVGDVEESRIASALARGMRIRAVGRLSMRGGRAAASVRLEELPESSPLAVAGGGCAIVFDTLRSGELCMTGVGAGPRETASALLRDIVYIGRRQRA
jgi:homoserine dehydrogenase